MSVLSLLSGGVQLLLALSRMAERRGHVEAGMNKVLVKRLAAVNEVLIDVKRLRSNLDSLESIRVRNKYTRRDT